MFAFSNVTKSMDIGDILREYTMHTTHNHALTWPASHKLKLELKLALAAITFIISLSFLSGILLGRF